MVSPLNMVILVACLAFFALRSYQKGIWQALLNLLGLVIAYGVSFLVAPMLGTLISADGIGGQGAKGFLAFVVAMVAIFFVVSTLVSQVPPVIFPGIKNIGQKHRLAGAFFGCLSGFVVAIALIWLGSIVSAMVGEERQETDRLSQGASKAVGSIVRAGIEAVEKDEYKAKVTAALVAQPVQLTNAFKRLSQSRELQGMWNDPSAQAYMAQGDISSLIQSDSYRALMSLPEMQQVIEQGKPEGKTTKETERYIANQMSFVWRRMRSLRSDQRVVEILKDPEVRSLVEKKNPLAMLGNEKIQRLMKIVMEEGADTSIQSSGLEPVSLPSTYAAEKEQPTIIYRWQDESGKTRYTDFNNTPLDKRETAEKIIH